MATVRLTQVIRSEILGEISKLYAPRIQEVVAKIAALPIGREVLDSLFTPEQMQLAHEINKSGDWIQKTSRLYVVVPYTDSRGTNKTHIIPNAVVVPPTPVPAYILNGSRATLRLPPEAPCYKEAVALLLEMDAITDERDALWSALHETIYSCGTLRQLIDVWPSALEFVPQHIRDRHMKQARSGAEPKEIKEIDDKAKHLLIKARLLSN